MRFKWMLMIIIVMTLVFAVSASAWKGGSTQHRFGKTRDAGATHKVSAGATMYSEIPGFMDFPMDDGDLAYDLYYEFHEGVGYWQFGASYLPSPENKAVEYVITPEISLILKDRIYRFGGGALISYVDTAQDAQWTDVYWQLIAGVGIPMGNAFSLDILGRYLFEEFDSFGDSDKAGFAYSALVSFSF